MSYPTLTIETGGVWLRFRTPQTPPGRDAEYPLLIEIGTLRSAARAAHLEGIGATESPNVSAVLDNRGRKLSELLNHPLRSKARIEQDGAILFEGLVSRIEYGNQITLEISA